MKVLTPNRGGEWGDKRVVGEAIASLDGAGRFLGKQGREKQNQKTQVHFLRGNFGREGKPARVTTVAESAP